MINQIRKHKANTSKITAKDKFTVLCLLIPLLSKYLLPSSLEELLKIEIFDLPIYIPYVFLILYLAKGIRTIPNPFIKSIFTLQFIFCFISWVLGDYPSSNHYIFLINLLSYFLCYYIGIYYTFNSNQLEYLRKLLTYAFIVVILEVILVNTGLVSFGVEQEANTETYGSIQRAKTTLGDTNNGGVALFLFGAIVIYLNKTSKYLLLIISAWVTACMLTVTKSVALAIIVICLVYGCALLYNKGTKLKKKLQYIVLAAFAITALFRIGVFDPIIARFVQQYVSQELQSGREDLRGDVLKKITDNAVFIGHGSGCVYPAEEFMYKRKYKTKFRGAPHNSYVLQYAENGIIGLSLLIIFWIGIIYVYRKADKFLLLTILCQIGIFFNTETVAMAYVENQLITAILLMLLISSKNEKNIV